MVAFVILHYGENQNITYQCIENLKTAMNDKEYHVVLVDNATPNGVGQSLKEYYRKEKYVTVMINEQNEGFARGNNIGYIWAKKNLNPSYIVVMNNDVMINDRSFLEKIEQIYAETNFYILGPDIEQVGSGVKQNPMRMHSKAEIKKICIQYRRKCKYPRLYYEIEVFQGKFRRRVLDKFIKSSDTIEKITEKKWQERQYGVVLHGAFYIIAKRYIDREDRLFDPRTFLYWEEYLLWLYCKKNGYTMVYDPMITVQHYSGIATNTSCVDTYERTKRFYKNYYNSIKILIDAWYD